MTAFKPTRLGWLLLINVLLLDFGGAAVIAIDLREYRNFIPRLTEQASQVTSLSVLESLQKQSNSKAFLSGSSPADDSVQNAWLTALSEKEGVESVLLLDTNNRIVISTHNFLPGDTLFIGKPGPIAWHDEQSKVFYSQIGGIDILPQNRHLVVGISSAEALQQQFLELVEIVLVSLLMLLTSILTWRAVFPSSSSNPDSNLVSLSKELTRDKKRLRQSIAVQEQAISQARAEALKASEIKSQFIANMSHEIRTPLNGIIGFTDLLLKTPLDSRQLDFLKTIKKSSTNLLQIINDILLFSKIEAGKIVLDNTTMVLREVVEEVMSIMAPAAHEKNIELVTLVSKGTPSTIISDPLRLKQILTNLVSNGIKFTNQGSVVVRIGLQNKSGSNATIKIGVSDTGIGISPEKQLQLFQAFTQADTSTSRNYGGTGLGLVITKQLIEQLNGRIAIESREGHGAHFWCTFKAKLPDAKSEHPAPKLLSGLRVIIFDQHPLARVALTQLLAEFGVITNSAINTNQLLQMSADAANRGQPYSAAVIGTSSVTKFPDQQTIYKELVERWSCGLVLLQPALPLAYKAEWDDKTIVLSKPVQSVALLNALSALTVPSAESQTQEEEVLAQTFSPTVKALAIDDNLANLKLVTTLLEEMAVQVTSVDSGVKALELLVINSFDIVFMDIQMPEMNGEETTRRIRSKPSLYRDIPIVAITAHALESERRSLLSAGMDDYLTKPVSQQDLADTIQKFTDSKLAEPSSPAYHARENAIYTLQEHTDPESISAAISPVDKEAAIALAAGKQDLAEELFSMFIETLTDDITKIKTAWSGKDYDTMLMEVHRIHGATRYCGVTDLQKASAAVEIAIKEEVAEKIAAALPTMFNEVDRLIRWAKTHAWGKLPQNEPNQNDEHG